MRKYRRGATAGVRAAANELRKFKTIDLEDLCPELTYKQIRNVIGELMRSGEFRAIEPGYYEYIPKIKKRTYLEIIWHLVRSHRQFETDEIQRLSGAKRYTVLEYLYCLRKLGYIRQIHQKHWLLINDPGPEVPVNTTKYQRLKRLRQAGKPAPQQKK